MTRQGRYPQELRERAVRMVFEHQDDHLSQWAAITSIASRFGVSSEVGSRRVIVAKATANPHSAWVRQQAKDLLIDVPRGPIRFLVRHRDAKYSGPFDEVFRSEGARIVRTPFRSPKANAYLERWVRTVRGECLDHPLILSRRHLDAVLAEFVEHYNEPGRTGPRS